MSARAGVGVRTVRHAVAPHMHSAKAAARWLNAALQAPTHAHCVQMLLALTWDTDQVLIANGMHTWEIRRNK